MRKLDYEFIFYMRYCCIYRSAWNGSWHCCAGWGQRFMFITCLLIVGSFLAIGGLLWGFLLVLNNDKVGKKDKTSLLLRQYLSTLLYHTYLVTIQHLIRKIALSELYFLLMWLLRPKKFFKIMLIHASMIRKFMKIVLALNSYYIY